MPQYFTINRTPASRLGNTQRLVYNAVKFYGKCHSRQVAGFLGWEINRVASRISELCAKGLLEESGRVKLPEINRTVSLWRVVD